MGLLLKDNEGWYIQKQKSNNKVRLIKGNWYLFYHKKKEFISLNQFRDVLGEKIGKPRFASTISYDYSGAVDTDIYHLYTHKDLEDCIEAPDNIRSQLDLMLMFSDQKHGK